MGAAVRVAMIGFNLKELFAGDLRHERPSAEVLAVGLTRNKREEFRAAAIDVLCYN